jgi:hypothetical protein
MKGKTRRSVVVLAVVAMIAALLAIPVAPAGAASAACDSAVSAGFTDLAGFTAETVNAIDCIASYGITKGTSATTYGPNADVSRWQMALFLTRKLTAAGVTLPSGADQGFTDISGYDAATQLAINQLAQLGITKGTSATTFDPTGIVNRWQMALFMTREVVAAGVSLPTAADQGFTDISALDAATQAAINQLAQLGISKGTTATTYDPMGNVNRWQMALFLARDLDVLGVVPAGSGNIVTAVAGSDISYADASTGKVVKVTVKSTDKFMVDGAAATQAAFLLKVTVGDLLAIDAGTPPTYKLTNKTATDYTSGTVANVTATTFDFVEPISGVTLATVNYTGSYTLYTLDGASASFASFGFDLSVGDTATTSGTGADASHIRTIALTNGTVVGTVATVGVGTLTIKPTGGAAYADVITPAAGDTLTVDGTVATVAEFNAEVSVGDGVSYSRKGDVQTIALTNAAPAATTGYVIAFVANTSVTPDSTGVAIPYAAVPNFVVDGVITTAGGFNDAVSLGDWVSYQPADTDTSTPESITLTNKPFAGTPDAIDTTAHTVALTFSATGAASDAVDYEATTAAGLTVGAGGVVKYMVDGASATEAQFESAVAFSIASDGGSVSLALVGVDLVWSATTP